MPIQVTHQPTLERFVAEVDGHLCVCDYRLADGMVAFTHTEVPTILEGRGIAGALVSAALAWVRAEGLQARPLCSYVAAYMRRHPETADLLATR